MLKIYRLDPFENDVRSTGYSRCAGLHVTGNKNRLKERRESQEDGWEMYSNTASKRQRELRRAEINSVWQSGEGVQGLKGFENYVPTYLRKQACDRLR